MGVINWRLMAHPLNWVVLFLMIFIAGIAVHLILSQFTSPDSNEEDA